jgi:hypothetical protein
MALTTVVVGGQINAADINQLVNVLQRSSGQSETGKYFLAGPIYATGAVVSVYICSLSRGATPVSVTIDEADQAHTGGLNATPSTGQLGANGFQIFSLSTTGPNVNARAGGNYTINY